MEEADRARVEVAAKSPEVVAAEAMLVPTVVHPGDPTRENQHEGRQRSQLVDSHPLLQLHPLLYLLRVLPRPPPFQVNHHHPRVEVARLPPLERSRQRPVRPERLREVGGEVGVAVLGGRHDYLLPQRRRRQLRYVVHQHQVGVQVHHLGDAAGEEACQVRSSVVERSIQRRAERGGYESGDR